MSEVLMYAGKLWLEWNGRRRPARQYIYQENEIVSPPYQKKVSRLWKAIYVNLHPTLYAIAVGPDGRVTNLKGGYNLLPEGRYNFYYVDKQNRVYHLPRTGETTSDGFQVAMELVITYRVIDPFKALEVQNAVDTLLRFIQSDLREFIRSHRYDEIVGDLTGRKIDNESVVRYIKDQHATRHQMSKLFFIADIVIKEKIGDPKVTQQRESSQMSQRQIEDQKVWRDLNQELTRKVTRQDAEIQQIRADAELKLQKSTKEIELQKIDLEKARANFQNQQENWRTAVGAIVQTLSNQPYPPDARVFEIIKELLNELHASTNQPSGTEASQATPSANEQGKTANPERIKELTRSLLNWRRPTPPA